MSSLQKFSQILEDFSQEVEQLKDTSEAYKKLQHLTDTYNEITKQFKESSKTFGEISELQKVQQEKVLKNLVELQNINKQNKIELAKLVEEKTDQIRKENKEFYKDLESTVKIKLDENKFQIKQLIESERSQIKQIFEIEFTKNTKELKQIIKAKSKTMIILLCIFGGLTVIFCTLALLRLHFLG